MRTSQAAARPLLEPDTRIGQFVIIGLAGAGTFGEVYKAYDIIVTQRFVAIKILRQQIVAESPEHQTALDELRMLSLVWHPSIVQLADHGLHDGRLWFAMPWIDGESLSSLVSRQGGLSRTQAQQIFEKFAGVIDCLHTLAGIRHQDIKPANVLITKLGDDLFPIMIDFGIGAQAAEQHLIGGTPLYVAPEVAYRLAFGDRGKPVSAKADIFSFGLTLLHCVDPSSMERVDRGTRQVFLEKRARHPPKPPKTRALRGLGDLFRDLIHADPERRPSASDVMKRLSVLTHAQRQRARMRRRGPWVALVATLTIAIIAWTVSLSRQNDLLHDVIAARESADTDKELADARYFVARIINDIYREKENRRQVDELNSAFVREQQEAVIAKRERERVTAEKNRAEAGKQAAEQKQNAAMTEKRSAEAAQAIAEMERESAELAKSAAEHDGNAAVTAKEDAEKRAYAAELQRDAAVIARKNAEKAAFAAQQGARNAEIRRVHLAVAPTRPYKDWPFLTPSALFRDW